MIWQIVVVLLLVAANGFFVAAEFALVKVRASEIKHDEAGREKSSRIARRMLDHLDSYLSACQLGITLASLGLGWAGEPMVARLLEPAFHTFGLPEENVHYFAFPVAFLIITFLHLTVGEQAPKIAAIQKARATTLLIAHPLGLFHMVFRPFISLINASSNGILKLAGLETVSEHDQAITEEEVRVILTQSAAVGHLSAGERRIMENVLDLEDKMARRHMVPRNQIVHVNRQDSMQVKLEKASRSGYTRLPLCDGDLDHIIGTVHIKDVFKAMTLEGELTTLVQVAREALFLHETVKLDALLKEFQKAKTHMAILVDEYGSVSGMITLEDVLEEMIGPIEDEFDSEEAPLIIRKGAGFEVDARCPIDEFVEKCGVEIPEELRVDRVDSVGGVLIESLGHIPRTGEFVQLGDHKITVLSSDPTKVSRVSVEKDRAGSEVGSND